MIGSTPRHEVHRLKNLESLFRYDEAIAEHPASCPSKQRVKSHQRAMVERGINSHFGSASKYEEDRSVLALSDNLLVHMISPQNVGVKNPAYLEYQRMQQQAPQSQQKRTERTVMTRINMRHTLKQIN